MNRGKSILFCAAVILSIAANCQKSDMQMAEQNKLLFVKGVEAINNRDWDALDDLIAPDYARYCQVTPDVQVNSLGQFKQYLIQDAATFPDSRISIDRLVAEGDLVGFFCTYVGTQTGQMGPFPPSNKQMTLEFAGVHRIENGKLAETWLAWDNLAALTQLGHLPSPEPKTE
jgi:predicted ester cyclase